MKAPSFGSSEEEVVEVKKAGPACECPSTKHDGIRLETIVCLVFGTSQRDTCGTGRYQNYLDLQTIKIIESRSQKRL